ncbi:unnamed protein product [Cuscuta campestris]|uniref:Uncharacterized protein n=1 Tax=Cuscuta campestris TaxID=132261 RepID=A0A484LJV2_9ASTE|nr:unnamed protein product [Cuscuta campestris]
MPKGSKKRARVESEPPYQLDSLPWNSSLPENDGSLDLLLGSNELGGGFLSLEEIDEVNYELEIQKLSGGNEKLKTQAKKQKIDECHDDSKAVGRKDEEESNQNRKKKSKKNKDNLPSKAKENKGLMAG